MAVSMKNAVPPRLTVEIMAFDEIGMTDDFAAGRSENFPAARLRVIAPIEIKGRNLVIFLSGADKDDERWRQVGSQMTVEIDAGLLEKGTEIFSGAAKIISAPEG
jgi:hypothetical protein